MYYINVTDPTTSTISGSSNITRKMVTISAVNALIQQFRDRNSIMPQASGRKPKKSVKLDDISIRIHEIQQQKLGNVAVAESDTLPLSTESGIGKRKSSYQEHICSGYEPHSQPNTPLPVVEGIYRYSLHCHC